MCRSIASIHCFRHVGVYLNSVFGKSNRFFAARGFTHSDEFVYLSGILVLVGIDVG